MFLSDGIIKSHSKKDRTPDMQYIDYGLGLFDAAVFARWQDGGASTLPMSTATSLPETSWPVMK